MTFSGFWGMLGLGAQIRGDERKRRQSQSLGIFLVLSMVITLALTITNLIEWFYQPDSSNGLFTLENLIVIGVIASLFWLNRSGYVRFSAYVFIALFLIGIPLTITLDWMPFYFLFFAVPIQCASFILHPKASLPVFVLCVLSYQASRMFIAPVELSMGIISQGVLGLLAVSSWWVSERLELSITESKTSEQKYQAMLEKNPYCVYMVSGSQAGRWTYVSPRILDLLGYSSEEWIATGHLWNACIHPDDRQRVLQDISECLPANLPYQGEYRLIHHSGRIVWVRDYADLAGTPDQPDCIQGVLLDITASKRTEQVQASTYRISEAAFAADDLGDLYRKIHHVLGELMHAENFFIALHDPGRDMLNFPYFVDQYDAPPESILARHGLTEYVLRTGQALFATQNICAGLVASGEISDVGSPSVDWLGVPLIINNRTIGVMVVQSYQQDIRFSDIDLDILKFISVQVAMVIERKLNENELREVNQFTGEVISGVNTGIIVYDLPGCCQVWNPYMEQITGLPEEMMLDRPAGDVFPFFRHFSLASLLERAKSGQTVALPDHEFSIPSTSRSGWLSGYCGPQRNAQGEIIGIIAVLNDITERKTAEESLRTALLEKEVLVREIHHRVKNNLQIMSSLISLQVDTIEDESARQHFMEMQARVRSMALIHEELYQSENLSRVNFATYIGKLAAGLMQSFAINPNMRLAVEVEEVNLGVDTAIPCGLIINELVTNAFKYAFPGDRHGEVAIRLRQVGDNRYCLTVSDDGVGIPPEVDIRNTETLGMQLITLLTRQLRGTLQVSLVGGTCFQIEFSEFIPANKLPG